MVRKHQAVWDSVRGSGALREALAILAACLGLISSSAADTFGRFGYSVLSSLPDWKVDAAGFRVLADNATHFKFATPSKAYDAIATNANAQTVKLDGAPLCPSDIRFTLIGDSLDLKFKKGFALHLDAAASPFLSWKEGSVGPKIATPSLKWVLLSFANDQPPIVLGFSGADSTLRLDGTPGDWTLSSPDFTGWLRLMLPFGTRSISATDALTLGKLAQMVQNDATVWSAKSPSVKNLKVTGDDLSVDADWTFDGPGAFLPPAATLAQIGGYLLTIQSPHHQLLGDDSLGPRQVVDGDHLVIHFPCRRIPEGRAVGLGQLPVPLLSSASAYDVPSVVELAFESLLAVRDAQLAKLADDTSSKYLSDVPYSMEPLTRQQLPYAADGAGLELAAAHALLAQATMLAVGSTDGNAMLDSVVCRRDWLTWRIWTPNPGEMITANILGGLAGVLSQAPEARLYGATLEAGVEATRGLQIWRHRNGYVDKVPDLDEPLLGLRTAEYALRGLGAGGHEFYDLLQSPVRIGVGSGVTAAPAGNAFILNWTCDDATASVLTLLAHHELKFDHPANLSKLVSTYSPNLQTLTYVPVAAGVCSATLELGGTADSLPLEVAPPMFRSTGHG